MGAVGKGANEGVGATTEGTGVEGTVASFLLKPHRDLEEVPAVITALGGELCAGASKGSSAGGWAVTGPSE